MKKTKRVRWEVRPASKAERKTNYDMPWVVTRNKRVQDSFFTKKHAVRWAAGQCREQWKLWKKLAELVIKGADGVIKDTRTYGKDPRKVEG